MLPSIRSRNVCHMNIPLRLVHLICWHRSLRSLCLGTTLHCMTGLQMTCTRILYTSRTIPSAGIVRRCEQGRSFCRRLLHLDRVRRLHLHLLQLSVKDAPWSTLGRVHAHNHPTWSCRLRTPWSSMGTSTLIPVLFELLVPSLPPSLSWRCPSCSLPIRRLLLPLFHPNYSSEVRHQRCLQKRLVP